MKIISLQNLFCLVVVTTCVNASESSFSTNSSPEGSPLAPSEISNGSLRKPSPEPEKLPLTPRLLTSGELRIKALISKGVYLSKDQTRVTKEEFIKRKRQERQVGICYLSCLFGLMFGSCACDHSMPGSMSPMQSPNKSKMA